VSTGNVRPSEVSLTYHSLVVIRVLPISYTATCCRCYELTTHFVIYGVRALF